MFEAGAFFKVPDGELDGGVRPVEPVQRDGVGVGQVGEEPEVAPVGPQSGLGDTGQAGAAHYQPAAAVDTLGDLGSPVGGVGDLNPRSLVGARDDRGDLGVLVRTAIV